MTGLLNIRLDGPQCQYWRFGDEACGMPEPVFEPRFISRPACCLVTIPPELYPHHKGSGVLYVLQTQGARMEVL